MSSPITVDSGHLEAARRILEREEGANPLAAGDMKRYARLNKVGYIGLVAAVVFGLTYGFYGLLRGEPFWYVVGVYVRSTVLFVLVYGWTFVIMIGLNLRLARTVQRRERLVASFGLGDALEAPWKAERSKHRAVNTATLLAGPGIWAFAILFVAYAAWGPQPENPEAWYYYPLWAVLLCALWSLAVGYMYLWLHRLRRSEERLRVIENLQSSLRELELHKREEGVEISRDVYEQIARIERAQISRERADSIRGFQSAKTQRVIIKSQAVREAQAQLDPKTRLRVEDAIEELASGSTDIDEAQGGIQWLRVEDTPVEIGFQVPPGRRRVQVLSLRSATGGEESHDGGEE